MEEEFGSQQGRAIIDSTVKMAPTNIQAQVEQEEQSQATNELAEDGVEDKQKTQDYAVDVNQIEAIGGSLTTNGSPKEETEDQKPRAEDLAFIVATGRQSRRARRQGGPRNEAMAKKAAEILGTTNKIQATKVEVGIAEEMESFEDKIQEESDDSEMKESSRPSLESSLFREPSQFMIAAQVPTQPILPALPSIHPHSKNNNVASTPMNTGVPSDPKAELFRQRAGHSSVFSDPTSPGAVPALGRAFGAWERPNARPTAAPLSMAADGIVTAETVDEEAVVYAEDVQWDNRARNKRMIIICALIALLVVVLVSVIIYVMNSEDDNDRCSKDHGEINIVVHCKCFNTAEFYIRTLDADEFNFYQQFVNHSVAGIPEETEMNSCLPQNQAVLEVAAVSRNGLNARKATEVIDKFSLGAPLFVDVFGIVLFYILMDGDNWERQDNWLETFDYCRYHGVKCTIAGRISSIALPRNGLAGTLPVETTKMMRNLYVLDLSDNEGIYGTLPAEITGNLTKLHELNLDSIGLSGTIPENIGNLKHLNKLLLRNNSFTGTLPSKLGELELVSLDLSFNQFTGSLPTDLGNQTSLQGLVLTRNKLTGTLPTELGKMASLEFLDLRNNTFIGSLPSILGNLSRLDTTLISNSGLTGAIPKTFCDRNGGDIGDITIEANCGEENETKMDHVDITSCKCCNRKKRFLIWCWEDGLERLLLSSNN